MHGFGGVVSFLVKGGGPAAAALKAPPSDLTQISQRNGGTFPELRDRIANERGWVASHGSPLTPLPLSPGRISSRVYDINDAGVIAGDSETSDYFETVARDRDAKLAANWVTQELAAALNKKGLELSASPVKARGGTGR
jgi:hypothetical protein